MKDKETICKPLCQELIERDFKETAEQVEGRMYGYYSIADIELHVKEYFDELKASQNGQHPTKTV